jgi:nucleotide-binding universal stress UspA family protein
MSFKTIVVHVDDSPRTGQRLNAAVRLAVDCGAELVGIYLVPTIELSLSVAALLPDDVVAGRLRETGDAQHRAEALFREAAATAGLTAIEWRAPAGPAIGAAVAHARCADLTVVGQARSDDVDAAFRSELTTTLMLSTGRPMLIVPFIGVSPAMGDKVLVAWDGGREASRAIADALPILERAKEVVVVSIDDDPEHPVADAPAQARLAGFLRRHGVEARIQHYDGSHSEIAERLLSHAADMGSTLIVMGGYGHARLREMVLGGATRSVLESMTVPVLMSH